MKKPIQPTYVTMPEYKDSKSICIFNEVYNIDTGNDYTDQLREKLNPTKVRYFQDDMNVCSLEDLIKLSKDVDPSNVFITLHRCCVSYVQIKVTQQTATSIKEQEEHNKKIELGKQKYKEECAVYFEKRKQYDLWQAKQELKAIQEKIKKLKNGT